MTVQEIREAAKVMEAYADGVKIQYSHKGQNNWLNWINESPPSFDWQTFDYRIKQEPKYRPFETQEECWNEMHKHPDFGWVKDKEKLSYYPIQEVSDTNHYRNLLNDYEFTDGTPFGIKEE